MPGQQVAQYYHRDIIGHRVVDMSDNKQVAPFNERIGSNDKKAELREAKRVKALKASTERRLQKFQDRKQKMEEERNQRDEQMRYSPSILFNSAWFVPQSDLPSN